jgi:D-serine deaminase-like pyridoxal phosphate-dependent protein
MMHSRFEQLHPPDYALPADVVERLLSPSLVVYLDRVRENLGRVIERAGGDPGRWRPHVKTTKIPEVFAEMTRAGLRHFKCATTREAAWLLQVLDQAGGGDVLQAYPLIGPGLLRLARLAGRSRSRVSVLCEDPRAVATIPEELSLFVDVNPGMNRTGVPLAEEGTIRGIARAAGDRFRGLHFYDGHVHARGAAERARIAHRGYDRLMELRARLGADGIEIGEIVTSGTPSFPYALDYTPFRKMEPTVHRVSPGTVVFHDFRYEQELEDLDLTPAALVFSRVVSHPTTGIVTCDAGSKSIAAEAGDPCVWVLGHPALEALTPSEEHLPLRVHEGPAPPRGTPLLLIPRHVCPTVNLAEEALLIDGGSVREVVRVRARAHDLMLDDERRT